MATRRSPETPASTMPSSSPPASTAKPLATGKIASPASGKSSTAPARLTPDMRRAMIAERAYLRAEKRGFAPGGETEDWLAAEVEIDLLLKASRGGSSQ
jgi:hypothetical protein